MMVATMVTAATMMMIMIRQVYIIAKLLNDNMN